MEFPINVDEITLPSNYLVKYSEFVKKEAKKTKRFLMDNERLIYLTNGKGFARETDALEVEKTCGKFDRHMLVTLWETCPATFLITTRGRKTQLVLRNELLNYDFTPDVLRLYPNVIELRRQLQNIPLLITPEYVIPVLYNPTLTPYLTFDSKHNLLYNADGKRGVFGKVIEEVCSLLANS